MKDRRLLMLIAGLLLFARSAAAQAPGDSDADRARSLKASGDEAMEALRYVDAYAAYKEACRLAPSPALVFNQGRALQALGSYPEALELFERFDAEAPADVKARVPGLAGLIAEVRQRVSTLVITCAVAGAQVRVRDRTAATCPVKGPLRVNAGHATIDVTADGYFPYHRELELPSGGITAIEVHLGSKQTSGLLSVASPVVGADVTVDRKPIGKVPVELLVTAGTHEVSLRHEGYQPVTTSTVVGVGEQKRLSVPMEAVPPITSKWWFWTGIGVALAGGAVLTYALVTERAPDSGTIAPGRASAPLRF